MDPSLPEVLRRCENETSAVNYAKELGLLFDAPAGTVCWKAGCTGEIYQTTVKASDFLLLLEIVA